MATLSSHKSLAAKTTEPNTEVSSSVSTPARTTSSPSLRSDTTSVPITPVKPTKPVTPTPAPKVVKVAPAPYFVSVDGCLHPLS